MKIKRNNSVYIGIDDLLRFPAPSFICSGIFTKEFVQYEGKEAIEYLNSRQDIVDYDSICKLDKDQLDAMINEKRDELSKLAILYLSDSFTRRQLDKDEEYQKKKKILSAIYCGLCNYKINKKEIDLLVKSIEDNCLDEVQKEKQLTKIYDSKKQKQINYFFMNEK